MSNTNMLSYLSVILNPLIPLSGLGVEFGGALGIFMCLKQVNIPIVNSKDATYLVSSF